MDGTTAAPFTIVPDVVVLEGGWGKGMIVVKPAVFSNMNFVSIGKENRHLSRAMGLDMTKRHPWGNGQVINMIS